MLVDVLQHMILSHHGEPEYGAAKIPATPEAILIHYIDNIDAKMTMSLGVTRSEGAIGEGNFTDFQKALGVRLFRPDVAFVAEEEPVVKDSMHTRPQGGAHSEHTIDTVDADAPAELFDGGKRSMHP